MKKLLLSISAAIILIGFTQQQALASHCKGADISYVCVGHDSFLVTLNFYRDCAGISAPTSPIINVTSAACGLSQSVTLNLTTFIEPQHIPNGSEVSALCGSSIGNSTCNNGNLPGVQQYQYSGLVVLPQDCIDWTFSYDLCCRNAAITNLSNPGGDDLYIEATLNSTIYPQASSPIFTNRPVPYFCYLDSIQYNQGTIDPNGDSLVYTLIDPLGLNGAPIPYNTPYSPTNPLSVNGIFGFDPTSGQCTFVPSQAQTAVIAILVQAYRNGVLIGSTIRDIQVEVLGNPTCVPPYGQIRYSGIDSSSVSGGVFISPYDLNTCPGDTVRFNIAFGGDSVYLSSNVALALPGARFDTFRVSRDSVYGTFTWVPAATDTGIKVFSLQFGVKSCPIDRTSSRTIAINVLHGTYAGPDVTYCTSGSPVQLYAIGGSHFTWSPAAGLSDSTIRNPLASPTVTTNYIVVSDLTGFCKNRDTLKVKVVPNFILSITPRIDTINICRNGLVPLQVVTDSLHGPYTYHWTPGGSLNDSTLANPTADPQLTTKYFVYVTSDSGCTLKDSLTVKVVGVGPQVFITTPRSTVCAGDTVPLTSVAYPVSCGPTIGSGSCGPGHLPMPKTFSGNGTSNGAVSPFSGSNASFRYQALYRASDLNASGITAGTIVKLAFNIATKLSNGVYTDFTIRLGCVNATQLNRNAWQVASTQVYYTHALLVNAGVNSFNLSQPYDWDGHSNLLMEICFGDSAAAGGDDAIVSSIVSYAGSMAAGTGAATAGCSLPTTLIPTNLPQAFVPNATFYFCSATTPSFTYQWTPTNGLSSTTTPNTNATINQQITYTLNVSDSTCSGSGQITLNIDTTTVRVTRDTALCAADTVQLRADIGGPLAPQCGHNGNACGAPLGFKQVGQGTNSNLTFEYPAPFGNFYGSTMQQYLYTAADLIAAGVTPGRINQIGFFVAAINGTTVYNNYTISGKCTTIPTLTSGSPELGVTTLYNSRNITINTGLVNFNLDSAIDWDGSSNLLIQICFDNSLLASSPTLNESTFYTPTIYTSSTSYENISSSACGGGPYDNTEGANFRPNTQFNMCTIPAPYTVQWTPGSTLSDSTSTNPLAFPNATTTYHVNVTTASGCSRQGSVTISVGSLPHTITRDTAGCVGSQIGLKATGGNSYLWSPATGLSCTTCANPTVTIDSTRTYTVSIHDSVQGCTVFDSVKVTAKASPKKPFTGNQSICFTDSFNLNAGGGYATYQWSPLNPLGNDSIFVVRTAGTYKVTITAASGCTVSDSVVINVRANPVVNLGPDTLVCAGNTVTLNAGSGYSKYNWSTNDSVAVITVNTSGFYSVTVTDSNGCKTKDTIRVGVNALPVVNLGNDTLICNSDSIKLSANNGPFYNYLWSTGSTDSIIYVGASNAGQIIATVVGGLGCSASDTINVAVRPALVFDLGNDTSVCVGNYAVFAVNGSFTSYQWSDSTTASTDTARFTGEYKVTVTDVNGCRGFDSVHLTVINTPVNLGNDTTLCAGDSLTLNAGAGFTSYLWSNAATTQTIKVGATNTYSVTVTPASGCPGVDSILVTFAPKPVVNLGNDTTICLGSRITLNAGLQSGSTIKWSTGDTTRTITVTAVGPYSVTVTNASGCKTSDTIIISNFPTPLFTLRDTTICAGDSATFDAGFGFTSYVWSPGGNTSETIKPTVAGLYKVTVTTAAGCTAFDSVRLTTHTVRITTLDTAYSICAGAAVTLDAGAGFTNYIWSTAATTETISATTAGGYTVTASDIIGCKAIASTKVKVNAAPTPNLGNDDTICSGKTFTFQAGNYLVYHWSDNSALATLTASNSGVYSVTVTDANGCTGTDTAKLLVYPAIPAITLPSLVLCPGNKDTLTAPSDFVSYIWSTNDSTSKIVVSAPGTYTVTVTDVNGCSASGSDTIKDGGFIVTVIADPSPINVGQTATLTPTVSGTGTYSYVWSPSASLNDSTTKNPIATPTVTTTYLVTVTNSDNGCKVTDSVKLVVDSVALYSFADAFTPNGDGHNDFFGIISTGNVKVTDFKIYDRWGNTVHNDVAPWDGKKSGTDQPTGTYVYTAVIEITDATGTKTVNYKGAFTLLR